MDKPRRQIPFSVWLVWNLRKISYRWPARYEALKLAKVAPNTYKCAECKNDYKKQGRKRIISVDHINPVKDPTKPQAFQDAIATCMCGVCDYIRRMFCAVTGLQVLCKKCHDKKTKGEMKIRKVARRKKKEAK